jgi:probable addiction module antidote protein
MALKTIPFDIVSELDNEGIIQEYFRQVIQDGDSEEIIDALGVIARARGMARLAKDCGLGRESLYKALSPGAKPRFDTILKVVRALGLELTATSAQPA